MRDLKLAFRTLRKTPFVTAIAVLSLALGIGANAAIFSLFDQILLSPLPVPDPERLVNLSAPGPKPGSQSCNQAGNCDVVFSHPMFKDLEAADLPLTGVAAHRTFPANLTADGVTESGQGMMVSGSYFPVLGLRPALGRLFDPADDRNVGEHYVVVLGYGYWQDRLGGDPSILNRTMVVNGRSMTVVGVAPRGFEGTTLGLKPDVYVPITMRPEIHPGWEGFENRRSYWAYLFARLQPDVTLEQAWSETNSVYQAIVRDVEAPLQHGMSAQTMERFLAKEIVMEEGFRGQSSTHAEAWLPLTLLFSITGIVLLIACANVANLLLARGATRGAEMAVRGSIGGSRAQLIRQLLTESLVLAAMGGAASLVVAYWTLSFVTSLLPPEGVATISVALSPEVMGFAAVLALGTGLVFGLYPALHSTRPDLVTLLKDSAAQPAGARAASRFRTGLVTAQLALAMTLLVPAGLFIRSLINVSRVDLGLAADNVVTFSMAPERNGYGQSESMDLFVRTEETLTSLPGVTGVTAAMVPILAGSSWGNNVRVEGFEYGPDVDSNSRLNAVGPGYFGTLGIPLLAGREFTAADTEDSPGVAIVNEAFARKFGLDPRGAVGRRMSEGGEELDLEIVGIVADAKYSEVKQATPPIFFRPYRQRGNVSEMTLYVRSATDPGPIMSVIPRTVASLDPNLPIEELKTLRDQAVQNVFLDRMISMLSAAFAGLATLLAVIGLYGVMAFTVAQRTKEIGLRMALGARATHVQGMVLGHVGRMTLVGAVVGIAAAVAIGRAAESLLFELEGTNPVVIGLVTVLLGLVALGAGYLPARRASRVDPMQALRYG